MASYKPIMQICSNCKEDVVLFPRSFQNGRMIAEYFDGSQFVFDVKTQTCYYGNIASDKVFCSKCRPTVQVENNANLDLNEIAREKGLTP